jgi:hypothetical protein
MNVQGFLAIKNNDNLTLFAKSMTFVGNQDGLETSSQSGRFVACSAISVRMESTGV